MRYLWLVFALISTAAIAQVPAPIGPGTGAFPNGLSTTPTAATCVGFALGTGSKDTAGKITYTSATTCSVNFGTTFQNPPACTIGPGTAASTVLVTTTTGGFAVTFGTAQAAFSYVCIGQ